LVGLATRFSVTAGGDGSVINIECLSANLEPSIKVLAKIFLDPLFSGLRIDAVKKHMEHQGQVEEDDSVRLAHLAGMRGFFTGTGYGGSTYGDKASLEAIKGKDVSAFYKSYFVGKNIIMSFASDLPDEAILELVGRHFGALPSSDAPAAGPVTPTEPGEKTVSLERDTKQAYVGLTYRLPAVSRRDFALASILESLLGKGQGSRLWPLRAERKLAYNVNCRVTQLQEGGVLEAYLETAAAKKEQAREALWSTLDDLCRSGIAEEELQEAKNVAKTAFMRDNESKAARAGTLAFLEAEGLGLEFFDGLFAEIDAVTLDEINAAIKEILAPGKALEVIVGPKAGAER
jgi:predicted Zn-dependent peptidase